MHAVNLRRSLFRLRPDIVHKGVNDLLLLRREWVLRSLFYDSQCRFRQIILQGSPISLLSGLQLVRRPEAVQVFHGMFFREIGAAGTYLVDEIFSQSVLINQESLYQSL